MTHTSDRLKVLFLTHRLPYAPNRGDRIRCNYVLRTLAPVADVHLVSLVHSSDECRHTADVEAYARTVRLARIPWIRSRLHAAWALGTGSGVPLSLLLLRSPEIRSEVKRLLSATTIDVVLASSSAMAQFAFDEPLASLPLVLDLVDVDSAKWSALASLRGWRSRIYARESRTLAAYERHAIERAFAAIVVTERERRLLSEMGVGAAVHVIPNGIDTDYLARQFEAFPARSAVFAGVMDYVPNATAAEWLISDIWPRVVRDVADAQLVIAGANPSRRLRALAQAVRNVTVTGTVADIRPYLWRAAIAVAPLRVARGVQNKVVEAVAAGLPVVLTPIAAEGLPIQLLPACRVASDPVGFAAEMTRLLLLTPSERAELVRGASLDNFHFSTVLRPLIDVLQAAAGAGIRNEKPEA